MATVYRIEKSRVVVNAAGQREHQDREVVEVDTLAEARELVGAHPWTIQAYRVADDGKGPRVAAEG